MSSRFIFPLMKDFLPSKKYDPRWNSIPLYSRLSILPFISNLVSSLEKYAPKLASLIEKFSPKNGVKNGLCP